MSKIFGNGKYFLLYGMGESKVMVYGFALPPSRLKKKDGFQYLEAPHWRSRKFTKTCVDWYSVLW